jgi:hypothetical protein
MRKSSEKVWKFKFGKKFDINQNCMSISKISKNYVKFELLSQKTLFLGQKVWKKFGKSLEKVWKKFGKSLEKVWKKFGNRVFQTFGNFGNFENCSIPNF